MGGEGGTVDGGGGGGVGDGGRGGCSTDKGAELDTSASRC